MVFQDMQEKSLRIHIYQLLYCIKTNGLLLQFNIQHSLLLQKTSQMPRTTNNDEAGITPVLQAGNITLSFNYPKFKH